MSYFQNPTGISYSLEKKKRIVELAEKYDFYIIEDDYLSELFLMNSYRIYPFKMVDKNDRVIYIKSFSKIFLTRHKTWIYDMLLKCLEKLFKIQNNTDIATSTLCKELLEMYITEGNWKENIKNLRVNIVKRYKLMKNLLIIILKIYVAFFDPKRWIKFLFNIKDKEVIIKRIIL